jgi:D-inositol-3-phosphate glycosyltransferase
MNILFTLAYYDPYIGGAELIHKRLAEGLVQRGHNVHVITTRIKDTPAFETIHGVTVERIWTPPFADRYFFTLLSIPAAIRAAGRADLVHTTPYNGALQGFLAARLKKKPVVFMILEVLGKRWQRVEPSRWKAWQYRLFEWLVTRLPYDRLVAISQATLRDALELGVDPGRTSHLYIGVDRDIDPSTFERERLRERLGLSSTAFIYAYFGRPGITKGVDVLLRAAPLVQVKVPDAHLVLFLSREPAAQYQAWVELAASLRERADITILPPYPLRERRELFEMLSGANCVVIPSRTEGFGLTAAEACMLGLPVVATTAGSLPEVISGRHVLVAPGDPSALAAGLLRAARGDWDVSEPKVFSWDAMVDGYLKLYRELLK